MKKKITITITRTRTRFIVYHHNSFAGKFDLKELQKQQEEVNKIIEKLRNLRRLRKNRKELIKCLRNILLMRDKGRQKI